MYVLNIEKVLKDKKLPSWILKAAFELNVGGYLPTGEFFEKLDDEEVRHMRICAKNVGTENYKVFSIDSFDGKKNLENLSLLCFILALGEGEIEITPDLLSTMLEFLFLLISIEYLHRNGEIQAIRENYSLLDGSRSVFKGKTKK